MRSPALVGEPPVYKAGVSCHAKTPSKDLRGHPRSTSAESCRMLLTWTFVFLVTALLHGESYDEVRAMAILISFLPQELPNQRAKVPTSSKALANPYLSSPPVIRYALNVPHPKESELFFP